MHQTGSFKKGYLADYKSFSDSYKYRIPKLANGAWSLLTLLIHSDPQVGMETENSSSLTDAESSCDLLSCVERLDEIYEALLAGAFCWIATEQKFTRGRWI